MNVFNTTPKTRISEFIQFLASQKAKLLSYAILLIAGAGVWICGSLVKIHDGGWQVNTENATLLAMPCVTSTASTSSCGAVTSSRWGSFDFFVGKRQILVPASLIGAIYFMAVILWFILQPTPLRWTRRLWTVTLFAQSCAMLASFFWLAIMAKTPHGWCIDCLLAHAANAIIFALIIWLRQSLVRSETPKFSAAQIQLQTHFGLSPAMTAMSIALVGLGAWLYFDATTSARHFWRRHAVLEKLTGALQDDPSYVLREFYAQPLNSAITEANDDRLTASVESNNEAQLSVFTNYESRLSRCFEATLGGHVRDAFGSHINIDFHHLPISTPQTAEDQSKLAGISTATENVSCQAAVAAYVQGGFQAFAAMRTKLLVNRGHHTRADIARMATSIGLNQTELLARMDGPDVTKMIETDRILAKQLSVESAPAAYLNGRRVPALCLNSEVFWKAIAQEMTAQAYATLDH